MQNNTYQPPKADLPYEYKLQLQKRQIRRNSNAVGLTVLIAFVVEIFLAAVYMFFAGIFYYLGFKGINNINFANLINEMLVVAVFVVPFAICAKVMNGTVSKTVATKKVGLTVFIGSTFVAFGINSLCNIANSIFANFMSIFQVEFVKQSMSGYEGTENILVSIICTAMLPALIEEFAFRGVMLGLLRKNMSDISAIFVSAIVFGIVHGNLVQLPFALSMGIGFGLVTVATNSIWPAITAHFLNNFCAVMLSSSLVTGLSASGQGIASSLFYVISTALLVVGILMLLKKDKNIFTLSTNKSMLSYITEIKTSVFSVGIILSIVVYGGYIVLLQAGIL